MEPHEIVALAQRVHNAEGWRLGASSTRAYRNDFWARVVGMVHHGHAGYGVAPDPRWHLKDGGGGRPQSDDVVVRMPDRHFWDCIGGVGGDGYTFVVSGDHGPLPAEQNVYPPPVPAPAGGSSSGGGGLPLPAPPSPPAGPDLTPLVARLDALLVAVSALRARVDAMEGQTAAAAHEALNAAVRASEIKTQIAALDTGIAAAFPPYEGRLFGQRLRLEPK